MKPFILSMLILITNQWTYAQSWNPFPKDQNSYFKQQVLPSTKVESFLMDSIKNVGALRILYFNAKSELKVECNSVLRQTAKKMYWAINTNKIDSLQQKGDSLLFINTFDSEIDTFIFKPLCKLNEFWTINGITIRCAEVGVMDVFGETDSIKTFKCSGQGFDSIEFILSKSHGFIKFLPFNAFHYLSILYHQLPQYFELVGYRGNGIAKGYIQPDFNDYFHLSAGDILYWREYSAPSDIQQHGYTKYHIDTLKYAYISPDSVFYKIKQAQFDENGHLANVNDFSQHHLRKDEGKILSNQTSWLGAQYSQDQTSNIFFLGSLELKNEKEDTITFANFDFSGFYLDTSTCETHMIYDVSSSVGFSTKEGLIFRGSYSWGEFSNTLVGSIINGVKNGITDIPTEIILLHDQSIKAYPNPVKNYLTIDYQDHDNGYFEVYDIVGRLMLSETIKEKIDLSALTPGAYILKIVAAGNAVKQIKIMKQ